MHKVNYLASFPHLANFPIAANLDDAELKRLGASSAPSVAMSGSTDLILTPAACYHVYPCYERQDLPSSLEFVTLETHCFRREEQYQPLRRHWSFVMREIVLLGARERVAPELLEFRKHVLDLACELGIEARYQFASDPFFNARSNPLALAQKLGELKEELTFGADLAIASINSHGEYFARAFDIRLSDGTRAHTACVAFGIERWMHAIVATHGERPERWPVRLQREVSGG